jgi:hypothetical protein
MFSVWLLFGPVTGLCLGCQPSMSFTRLACESLRGARVVSPCGLGTFLSAFTYLLALLCLCWSGHLPSDALRVGRTGYPLWFSGRQAAMPAQSED